MSTSRGGGWGGEVFSGYEICVKSESELWFISTSSCCQVLEVSQDAQVAEHIYIAHYSAKQVA